MSPSSPTPDPQGTPAPDPDGWMAEFKALCAVLGVETRPRTDTFGRPDLAIDREGLQKLIEAGLLPDDPAKLPGWGAVVRHHSGDEGGAS